MLQFYNIDDDTILKYETEVRLSKKILKPLIIDHQTLWGAKSIQLVGWNFTSYSFTLMGVKAIDFYELLNHLKFTHYWIVVKYNKLDFGLETKTECFIKDIDINDERFIAQRLDDVERLIDVRFSIIPLV